MTRSAPSTGQLKVVGIGASAGGLAALQGLLDKLPPNTGMAYVIVVHLAPERESSLAELLQRRTAMPVTQVTDRVALEPDHVYVIPPDRNLSSVDGHLELSPRPPAGQNRAPIDHFFRTLAETHGGAAAAVVLSGTGTDGALGLRRIKERGGLTIVQDPVEAEHDGMPLAAVRTGAVDRVVAVGKVGVELRDFHTAAPYVEVGPVVDDLGVPEKPLASIIRELRRRCGHDFAAYKRSTILRRLHRRMQLVQVETMDEYLQLVRDNPEELEALDRDLLIVVTSFFRDPEAFAALEEQVIPKLFEGKGPDDAVRVWAAGCATGEEAYTLAILLGEHARTLEDPPQLKVFASDVSEHAFNLAREGLYPEGIAVDLSEERIARNFDREKGGFRVKKSLRDLVLFASHDLTRDPPFAHLDLIACRNVLIYLRQDAQRRLLELFSFALEPNGHLFLGTSESVDQAFGLFSAVDKTHKIFRSRGTRRDNAAPHTPVWDRPTPSEPSDWVEPPPRKQVPGALHQTLVELYAPPSLVVDDNYEILHLSERAGRYLSVKGGEPSSGLLDLIRGDLKLELRGLLHRAFRDATTAEGQVVRVEIEGQTEQVQPIARPLSTDGGRPDFCLIVFQPVVQTVDALAETETAPVDPSEVSRFEAELKRVRDQLQATTEDHAETLERFQVAYEELQSTNEEQHATAEELETSKEELQSVNEELRAVNQEHRGKNEELAELNADLRNLINSTDIATIFLTRDLAVRRYTPGVTELFNFVSSDIGRSITDVTNHLDYPQLVTDVRRVLDTLERIEREVRHDDGRWFTVRMAPYRSQEDRIEGAVLTLVDTTERKRSDGERERLLAEANSANIAKSNFLGVLSHEFRTPLSGIIGYTDLLAQGIAGDVNPKQRQHLGRIKLASNQIMTMVEEILSYAQLESGKATLQISEVEVAPLLKEIQELLEPAAYAKKLEIHCEVDDRVPTLRTDEGKLKQILTNLAGNAVKFTAKGHVVLRARPVDSYVVIEVEDTGIGITPDQQKLVFDRFWQAHSGDTRIHGGTGLGLTVVRDLARLLGGDVSVESELGQGSKFTVSLPLVAPQSR